MLHILVGPASAALVAAAAITQTKQTKFPTEDKNVHFL